MGRTIKELRTTSVGVCLSFSDNLTFRMIDGQIRFGLDDARTDGEDVILRCERNWFFLKFGARETPVLAVFVNAQCFLLDTRLGRG